MLTHKPAVAYSLDGQIDLFIDDRSHQILRAVSFDDGDEWTEWAKMKNQKTRMTVGFASTGDGRTKYMTYQAFNPAAGTPYAKNFQDDGKYVLKGASHYGFDWTDSTEPMGGGGKFLSGPAVLCSPDGDRLYLFGLGMDSKIYWAGSDDRGTSWLWRWAKIGDGVFKSEPAAVMSADGKTIMLFAIGMDDRCYFSRSLDGGSTWNPYCAPVKGRTFTSGPSACISADGKEVLVAARGEGDRIYFIRSADKGASWKGDWSAVPFGRLQQRAGAVRHLGLGQDICLRRRARQQNLEGLCAR
jgi:hypothetical protein